MAGKKRNGAVGHKRQRGKDTWELNYRRQRKTITAKNEREAAKALANLLLR